MVKTQGGDTIEIKNINMYILMYGDFINHKIRVLVFVKTECLFSILSSEVRGFEGTL